MKTPARKAQGADGESKRESRKQSTQNFPGWIGMARVTDYRDTDWEIVLREHKATGQWEAVERAIERGTKAVTVKRAESFADRATAMAVCQKWKRELDEKRSRCAEQIAAADPRRRLDEWPEGCRIVTKTDLEDADKAALGALRRDWPRCAAAVDTTGHSPASGQPDVKAALGKAFLLDYATLTGRLFHPAEIPALVAGDSPKVEAAFFIELGNALKAGQARVTKRRDAKRLADDAVNTDLRLNWLQLGFCFLTAKQLAEMLNKRHKRTGPLRLTPAAIKTRLHRLKLLTNRNPGPSPLAST